MTFTRGWALAGNLGLFLSASSAVAADPAIVEVLGISSGPAPLDPFRYPLGIAVDGERGIAVVADSGNNRLVVLDGSLRSRGSVSYAPSADGDISVPRAVALDGRGRLLVVESGSDEIEVMNSRGTHLAFLRPVLPDELTGRIRPCGIAAGASGLIYVLYEGERPGYLVMDPNGRVLRRVGFAQMGEGDFTAPMALAVNRDESRVAVVDAQSPVSVRVFDAEGAVVVAFGGHGNGEGTFSLPVDVSWGPGETLWVTDSIRHSVSVFDAQGAYRGRVGGFGYGPGQFYYPVACEFAGADRVVVLERAGARVQVIEIALPDSGTERGAIEPEGVPPLLSQHQQWR
jgi:DNA-binding beta-propeller fold protein YncE